MPDHLAERFSEGRTTRKHLRRADLANWNAKLRRQEPLALLAQSMHGRVPALVSLKYERMACSPFGFFRGAVPIMASDLALQPHTGIFTQLCGDAHVRNLGAFAAPDGRLVFDINDFDETIPGPFEWDVKRMATSVILAGREAGAEGPACLGAVHAFLGAYRHAMHRFAAMPVLELARYVVHRVNNIRPVAEIFALAERATPMHNLDSLTQPDAHRNLKRTRPATAQGNSAARIFRSRPPNLTRVPGRVARSVIDSLATYAETLLPERRHFLAQYTPVDVAFKVVGTGSVGLRDYCIYLEGNGPLDPLFLQVKEEPPSAYAIYLGDSAVPAHQGRRVAEGQRAMQLQSDPFLGWSNFEGRDYLVRQLNDHKGSIAIDSLKPRALMEYAAVCGETLARGHARAGVPGRIAGYIGTSVRFDAAIAKFALAYADQTERDWKALVHSRLGKPVLKSLRQRHAR